MNKPIIMSRAEATCAVRHLRIQRSHLQQDVELIEERMRGLVDKHDDALSILKTECEMLDEIIKKLWRSVK